MVLMLHKHRKCLWLTHSMVAWPALHQATYLSSFLYSVEKWLLMSERFRHNQNRKTYTDYTD